MQDEHREPLKEGSFLFRVTRQRKKKRKKEEDKPQQSPRHREDKRKAKDEISSKVKKSRSQEVKKPRQSQNKITAKVLLCYFITLLLLSASTGFVFTQEQGDVVAGDAAVAVHVGTRLAVVELEEEEFDVATGDAAILIKVCGTIRAHDALAA